MKTVLQKMMIGIIISVAFLIPMSVQAQIDYTENFSGDVHGWSFSGFETTNVASCKGDNALRARINNLLVVSFPAWAVSPAIGVSNGEKAILSYKYKLLNYDSVLPVIPLNVFDFGTFTIEYATSPSGPWFDVETINAVNHVVSADCVERIVSFMPPEGSTIYLRVRVALGISLDLDYYLYIDEVNVTQQILTVNGSQANKKDLVVYPNPVKNYLNFDSKDAVSDIKVYNMQGQEVLANNDNKDLTRIDMSGLSQGAYIVKVTANNNVKTINVMKE